MSVLDARELERVATVLSRARVVPIVDESLVDLALDGQQVPVGMGISTVKVSEITVGGTKVKPQVALGEFREVGNVA